MGVTNHKTSSEYCCQKCGKSFKTPSRMIQHYQKDHSNSNLERTKEDLLLYIFVQTENDLVMSVKNNFDASIEACDKFSKDVQTIEKVLKEMKFRRVLCKNNAHNRCSMEKQAHCEIEPTMEECKFLLSKIFYFAQDQKLSEFEQTQNQEPNDQDQIEDMFVSPEVTYDHQEQNQEPKEENSWLTNDTLPGEQQNMFYEEEVHEEFESEVEQPNNSSDFVKKIQNKMLKKKLNPNDKVLVKKLQDFNTNYFKIKKLEISKQKRHFSKYNKSRKQFCDETGFSINLIKDLCERREFKIESKNGQWIITE